MKIKYHYDCSNLNDLYYCVNNSQVIVTIVKLSFYSSFPNEIYHLPGGKFNALPDIAKTKTKYVKKHDLFAEMALTQLINTGEIQM